MLRASTAVAAVDRNTYVCRYQYIGSHGRPGSTYRQKFRISSLRSGPEWVAKPHFECTEYNIIRILLYVTETSSSCGKGEVKRAKSKGQRRAAFRLLDFKEPTRVLQMRVKRNKNISPKEGWGQASTPPPLLFELESRFWVGATEAGMTSSAVRDS